MPQYVVLQALSPEQGPLIVPNVPDRNDPMAPVPPVIVDESVVSDEAAPILIDLGVIALLEPIAVPAMEPDAAPAVPPESPDAAPAHDAPEPHARKRRD